MGLRAGLLREVVTVKKPVISVNDYGEQVQLWDDVVTTRARVTFNSGQRAVENHEVWNPYQVTFVMRYYHVIDGTMVIEWQGKRYNIISINKNVSQQMMTIIAEVVNE